MVLFVDWHLDIHWHWTQYNQNWLNQREWWRVICIFIATLITSWLGTIIPSHHSWPVSTCLSCWGWGLGDQCVLCQQSLMANSSKFSPNHLSSLNFYLLTTARELLSYWGQWPGRGQTLWNWSTVLSYKLHDKNYHHASGTVKKTLTVWVKSQVKTTASLVLPCELLPSLVSSEYSLESFQPRSKWVVYKVYNSVLCNITPGLRQTPGMK